VSTEVQILNAHTGIPTFFVRKIEEYLSSIFLKTIKSVHSSPFKSY